jgi:hypothetical protein
VEERHVARQRAMANGAEHDDDVCLESCSHRVLEADRRLRSPTKGLNGMPPMTVLMATLETSVK